MQYRPRVGCKRCYQRRRPLAWALSIRARNSECWHPATLRSGAHGHSGTQCSFKRGSVPRPIRLPSISIAVRKTPYSAIWCMRYSEM